MSNPSRPAAETRDPAQKAAQWIRESGALVSPPDICIKLFELMETDKASAQALGSVISRDPSLTARLLRIVNSSFYGFSRRIDTVSRAVAVIGTSELYNLVVAVSAITSFSRIPNFIINIDTFWRHGIYCGIMARELARRLKVLHPERMFVAGMLHDIGSLIVYQRAPDTIKNLLLASRGSEAVLSRLEAKTFGFNHAELGGMLLDRWQLPPQLAKAVRYHHNPAEAEQAELEASIIHVSDSLANHCEQGAFYASPGADFMVEERAMKLTGLDTDESVLAAITEQTRAQYRDAIDLFGA